MKKSLLAAATALGLVFAGGAMAEGALSYNIAVTNDYVWRGVSQTGRQEAVQGGIDYTNGIFYAGAWASNVDFGDNETDLEVDVYAGVKPTYKDFSFDFGGVYYGYPNQPDDTNLSFGELKAAVSHPIGAGAIGAAAYYSMDFRGAGESLYSELNASYPITEKLSVSGAMGKQYVEDGSDWTAWNLGAGYALTEALSVDVRYWDTGDHDLGSNFKDRIAVTLKAAF
ncbi:MAG: hypothetical protein B7Z26_06155 [Asticcacaulis sp. 32-58-5]|nr:MAG: hypothetical protein B7Z26_06155 [Asticcacaulis sp. 32-58-5]